MKRIVLAMAAHVDAGKTTLSEAMLYRTGEIRRLGRVDNGDAFLDSYSLERKRGITVFSKQAAFRAGETYITLIDTPGHADLTAETERAFYAPDYALVVISAPDGVQSHTETLWKLLSRYEIPAFVFVNKTDISYKTKEELLNGLQCLGAGFVDFSAPKEEIGERAAELDEECMNAFLDGKEISREMLADAIAKRRIFPVLFGAALRLDGVDELLKALDDYTKEPRRYDGFAGKVYKITRDDSGARLTHIKISGGALRVKDIINGEKIAGIRVYSGAKFKAADEALSGMVCAVTGLDTTYAGQGLGLEKNSAAPFIEPFLRYKLALPEGTDATEVFKKLKALEEQVPELKPEYSPRLKEIEVRVMGEIQLEVLKNVIAERLGLDVEFEDGGIAYKETIADAVEGVGHYEPLRHYAEVHLLMEPAERGSGLCFRSDCRTDELDTNWQRLILTHLAEKQHLGVLTGSPITDMKITVIAGRAHIKHTEGGDFRQATYRAVRQGLASAESVLLEPFCSFTLTIPTECVGRAMTDLQRAGAEFSPPQPDGEMSVISGSAPLSEVRGYHREVVSYSHGKGRFVTIPTGYYPCHNAEEVIERIGYDFERDVDNPADSVFCSHGAGVTVKWNDAPGRMHVDSGLRLNGAQREDKHRSVSREEISSYKQRIATDKELMEIFERTYGKIKRNERTAMRREKEPPVSVPKLPPLPKGPEYLLVDGYNIIHAWDELKALAAESLDYARTRLIDILCNYRGFRECNVILVFDAYKVKGAHREVEKCHNITVIYTKEAETADMYIEKTSHELAKTHRVRVATSDYTEQIIIMGSGALRISATEFLAEVEEVQKAIRDIIGG